MNFDDVPIYTGENLPATQQRNEVAAIEVESQRAVQEVQAAMVVAKRFPRDQFQAYNRILEACKRPSLASSAEYAYPRGGTMITGPSIRLAEVLANNWGNIQSGIVELSRGNGFSEVLAYAWDLETNTRKVMQFQVRHERETKKGTKTLEGSRDIYELVANQGARRLRACILSVIPGDIVDAARKRCDETLKKGGEPLEDRIRKMVVAFSELGVTTEMLEKRLQHKMESTIVQELVGLGKIYQSLKDGMAKREDFFDVVLPQSTPQQPELTPPPPKRGRPPKQPETPPVTEPLVEIEMPEFGSPGDAQEDSTVCPYTKDPVNPAMCADCQVKTKCEQAVLE